MCRSKSEANYYRCDWTFGQLTSILKSRAQAIEDLPLALELDESSSTALDGVQAAALEELVSALEGLSAADQAILASSVTRGRTHLLCTIAALVGEACAAVDSLTGDIAKQVGKSVKQKTGSSLLGKVASAVAKKWLSVLLPGADSAQLGLLADLVAVSSCPSQQTSRPGRHKEVVECEKRLRDAIAGEMTKDILATDSGDGSS